MSAIEECKSPSADSLSCSVDAANAERVVLKLIQKSFKKLDRLFQTGWTPASLEALAALSSKGSLSIRDLWEQYQLWTMIQTSDNSAAGSNEESPLATLLSTHGGLREAMLYKLYTKIMSRGSIVEENLKKMEEFCATVSVENQAAEECFTRRQSAIGLHRYTSRGVTRLSTIELLQLVQRLDSALQVDVDERKLTLQKVNFSNSKSLEQLIELWKKNNTKINNCMKEIRFLTQHFVEDESQDLENRTDLTPKR